MTRPPVSRRRRASLLALLGLALTLPFARNLEAAAQPLGRPGVSVRFVQIGGGTGGIEGRAYLPAMPSNVVVSDGPGSCAGGRWIEMTARARTGHVREVHVTINATGPGEIALNAAGPCPSATIEATLDDGTELRSNDGAVTVRELHLDGNPILIASFNWSPIRNGQPMPFRGEIVVPAPAH